MIEYKKIVSGGDSQSPPETISITACMLDGGFFVGWPNPPNTAAHLRILESSHISWVAINTATNKVVGFINAVSDGIMAAYIPLFEVLPEYQNRGIGKQLVSRMLDSLKHLYMVDLICDEETQDYYAKFGMYKATGMMARNYGRQNCE